MSREIFVEIGDTTIWSSYASDVLGAAFYREFALDTGFVGQTELDRLENTLRAQQHKLVAEWCVLKECNQCPNISYDDYCANTSAMHENKETRKAIAAALARIGFWREMVAEMGSTAHLTYIKSY